MPSPWHKWAGYLPQTDSPGQLEISALSDGATLGGFYGQINSGQTKFSLWL